MPLAAGTRLGPYDVVGPLGAGGMGEVHRARDTRLGRDVAVKILPSDVASDAERRARFKREARAVAALEHPHICGIHDVGEANGVHYLVMPLPEGQTLAARLEQGPVPIAEALTIAGQVAEALDKAHRHGIVHRDLKPANVMLTKTGAKLLDFGVAKLRAASGPVTLAGPALAAATTVDTAAGTILGTVHYMAPEQVEGKEADARSDIWALGVVLYEMVTGVRPFQGDTAASVIGAILKDTPARISVSQPARLSPDQRRLAFSRVDEQANSPDIWILDLARGTSSRFTTDIGLDTHAAWSPDGQRVVFRSYRSGIGELYEKSSSGGQDERLVAATGYDKGYDKIPADWSRDGRVLVYGHQAADAATRFDIWTLALADGKATEYLGTQFTEVHARLSPDSRFIAFASDESGQFEIYVQTFPAGPGKWQISQGGGA